MLKLGLGGGVYADTMVGRVYMLKLMVGTGVNVLKLGLGWGVYVKLGLEGVYAQTRVGMGCMC